MHEALTRMAEYSAVRTLRTFPRAIFSLTWRASHGHPRS
jgi:hypothetical protein